MNIGVGPQGISGTDGTDVILDLALSVGPPGDPGAAGADGIDSEPGQNGINQHQPNNPTNGINGANGANSANSINGARGPAVGFYPYAIMRQATDGTSTSVVSSNGITCTVAGGVVSFSPQQSGIYRLSVRIQSQSGGAIALAGSATGSIGNGLAGERVFQLVANAVYNVTIGTANPYSAYIDLIKRN